MRFSYPMTLIALLALAPGFASAGDSCGGAKSADTVVEHIFDSADEDGSGTLSAAEYDAARLGNFGVTFAESDTDGNGETSKAEYLELYERHHSAEERIDI